MGNWAGPHYIGNEPRSYTCMWGMGLGLICGELGLVLYVENGAGSHVGNWAGSHRWGMGLSLTCNFHFN